MAAEAKQQVIRVDLDAARLEWEKPVAKARLAMTTSRDEKRIYMSQFKDDLTKIDAEHVRRIDRDYQLALRDLKTLEDEFRYHMTGYLWPKAQTFATPPTGGPEAYIEAAKGVQTWARDIKPPLPGLRIGLVGVQWPPSGYAQDTRLLPVVQCPRCTTGDSPPSMLCVTGVGPEFVWCGLLQAGMVKMAARVRILHLEGGPTCSEKPICAVRYRGGALAIVGQCTLLCANKTRVVSFDMGGGITHAGLVGKGFPTLVMFKNPWDTLRKDVRRTCMPTRGRVAEPGDCGERATLLGVQQDPHTCTLWTLVRATDGRAIVFEFKREEGRAGMLGMQDMPINSIRRLVLQTPSKQLTWSHVLNKMLRTEDHDSHAVDMGDTQVVLPTAPNGAQEGIGTVSPAVNMSNGWRAAAVHTKDILMWLAYRI